MFYASFKRNTGYNGSVGTLQCLFLQCLILQCCKCQCKTLWEGTVTVLKLCSHWHFRIYIITKMHESAQHSCTKMLVSKRSVGDALWRHRGWGMLAIVSSSRCLHSSWIGSLTARFWSNILYPLGASCDQSPHPTPPLWSIRIYLFFFVSWPGCPEKLHIAVLGS